MRKIFIAMVCARHTMATSHNILTSVRTMVYIRPPTSLNLKHVTIIHRHGDRAQISKHLGVAFPESSFVTEKWKELLPKESTLRRLHAVAKLSGVTESSPYDRNGMYSGWDHNNSPYSQLTEIGAQQLIVVGSNLRKRYMDVLIPNSSDFFPLYCRSTYMCRTVQSLRSLLVGLLGDEHPTTFSQLPVIHTRPRSMECMYAQADGRECPPLTRRRAELDTHPSRMPLECGGGEDFTAFASKMQSVLQFSDGHVRWMDATDVLTSHHAHGIEHIRGVSGEDVQRVSAIAAWIWGVIYKDDQFNSLAIGRFLDNLLCDMHAALGLREEGAEDDEEEVLCANNNGADPHIEKGVKMSIYSGHDSTLVPIMCALGIYEDTWPQYASCLSLEVAQNSNSAEYFVRAIFNDQPKHMRSCISSTDTTDQMSSVWCPMPSFVARLRSLAIVSAKYEILMKQT